MSSLELWLVRHGETFVNIEQWSDNPAESRLTPLGLEQAKKCAENVVKMPDLLITSPLRRAQETSQFFIDCWSNCPVVTLPIQEFIYLSPRRLSAMDKGVRREEIENYWLRNDPYYCDGNGSESFASFLERVSNFHHFLMEQKGFVVVIGHGQFFKAFLLGLTHGFTLNQHSMILFRKQETTAPMKNGEIIKMNMN